MTNPPPRALQQQQQQQQQPRHIVPHLVREAAVAVARGMLVRRVTRLMLGVGAHVHGDAVAVGVVRGEPQRVGRVECSVCISTAHLVPRLLATEFRVTLLQPSSGGIGDREVHGHGQRRTGSAAGAWTYRVASSLSPLDDAGVSVELALVQLPSTAAAATSAAAAPAFDFQTMSLAPTRMYVRQFDGLRRPFQTDHVVALLGRVREKRFRLLGGPMDVRAHGVAMCRAARMVLDDGWRMDAPLGGGGWVVAPWSTLCRTPGAVRVRDDVSGTFDGDPTLGACMHANGNGNGHAHAQPPRETLCPICHDVFCSGDVVVNLPCNHNMHAVCNCEQQGGLCAWLAAGQATCPCCRAPISSALVARDADAGAGGVGGGGVGV